MPAARQTTLDHFIARLAAIGSQEIARYASVAIDKTTLVARDRMRDATRRILGHAISGPGGLSGSRTPPDYTVNAIRARQSNWRGIRDGDDIVGDVHVAADQGSHNNDQSAYLKYQFGEGSQVRFPGDVGLANTRVLVWNPLDILLTTKIGVDPYPGARQPRGLLGKLAAKAKPDISTGTKSDQMRRIAAGSGFDRDAPLTSLAHRLQVARATIGKGGLDRAIAHAARDSGPLDRSAVSSGLRAFGRAESYPWAVYRGADKRSGLPTFYARPKRVRDPAGGKHAFRRSDGSTGWMPNTVNVAPEYGESGRAVGPRSLFASRPSVSYAPKLQPHWEATMVMAEEDLARFAEAEYQHTLERIAQGRSA